jgi:hypothetical protein
VTVYDDDDDCGNDDDGCDNEDDDRVDDDDDDDNNDQISSLTCKQLSEQYVWSRDEPPPFCAELSELAQRLL